MLHVTMLGVFEVLADGHRIDLGPAKQRILLAALALDVGYPVAADVLAERIWDDVTPRDIRGALYTYVARVRRVLARAERRSGQPIGVQRRSGGYELVMDPDRIDLHRFRDLLARARGAGTAGSRGALLGESIGLWRADALSGLPGDWAQRTRAALHQQRLGALIEWADTELALGHYHAVLEQLTVVVAHNPLVEPVVARLMQALSGAGRGTEALDVFSVSRRRITGELGTEPGPALRALHHALLRGTSITPTAAGPAPEPPPDPCDPPHRSPDPRPDPADSSGGRRLPPAGRADPSAHPPLSVAAAGMTTPNGRALVRPAQLPFDIRGFVGREHELAELDRMLAPADLEPHALPICVVAGTAGVGKTALVVHWAHRSADRYPDGQLFVDLGDDSLRTGSHAALGALLRALGVDRAELPDDSAERVALYRSVLAARRVLLVVDGSSSVEQVLPLLPGTGSAAVLVTSRDPLAGLVARYGARRVQLDVLPPGDALALLRTLAGPGLDQDADVAGTLARWRCARLPLAVRTAAEAASSRATGGVRPTVDFIDARCRTGPCAGPVRPCDPWVPGGGGGRAGDHRLTGPRHHPRHG